MKGFRSLCLALTVLALSFGSQSFSDETNNDPVHISLVSENLFIKPGQSFWVAVEVKMDKEWHAYWKNPGDAGMPPVISWTLPEGYTAKDPEWPTPKRFDLSSMTGLGYEDTVVFLTEITPPDGKSSDQAEIKADVHWLVCSDMACLPGDSEARLTLLVKNEAVEINPSHKSFFQQARLSLPKNEAPFTAERENNLVKLSLVERNKLEGEKIDSIDFFPEAKNTIDYKSAPTLEKNQESGKSETVILKESNPAKDLKGVLVINTEKGTKSYNINLPIQDKNNGALENVALNDAKIQHENFNEFSNEELADISFDFDGGVGLAIALAFLGGLFLNLMPCVLPVISFKVMSFIKLAGESRRLIFQHGLAFTGGVLLSFWVLAALLLTLQAYGRSVGWGFQLQEPIFVASLATMIFVFALSLFGLFEVGTSVMGYAGDIEHKSNSRNALFGSFMSGILATAVATPCTGPFLGTPLVLPSRCPRFKRCRFSHPLALECRFLTFSLPLFHPL